MSLSEDMFRQPTNSLPGGTRPVTPSFDIMQELIRVADQVPVEGLDLVEEAPYAPMPEDDIVDAKYIPAESAEDDFPLDAYDTIIPPEPERTMAPDMSSLLPAARDLELALDAVSIDELRRAVDAGVLMNVNTDPFGQRLRYTIRRLVRGM